MSSLRGRPDQAEWLRVRHMGGRGPSAAAVALYPAPVRASGGHVLAGPGWLLGRPVPLEDVRIEWSGLSPAVPEVDCAHVLPEGYDSYAVAVRDLVRPRLMEDRPSYRLLGVDTSDGLTLSFGLTSFFAVFNVRMYLSHELKAVWPSVRWDKLPYRAALGDPFNPLRVLTSPGIGTLTIRRSPDGDHRFVLHERDAAQVADGGGLCSVMPAGEFQPTSDSPDDVRADFSLWRNMVREYAEEFLGAPEPTGGVDYNAEPYASFTAAREAGGFRVWHYGMITDPLTLATSQRTVAVVDADVYDDLFAGLVSTNEEGRVIGRGVPFTEAAVAEWTPRLSVNSLALLTLALRDRELLLGN